MTDLSPAQRAAALQALAEALEDQYPGLVAIPLAPGQTPPPGARVLPAALEPDLEPLGDVRVPRPRRRRRDHHPVDQ